MQLKCRVGNHRAGGNRGHIKHDEPPPKIIRRLSGTAREEVLSRLTHLARHGETERIRMDALTTVGRYHSLWSDTLHLRDRERDQAEAQSIAKGITERLNTTLYGGKHAAGLQGSNGAEKAVDGEDEGGVQ